MTILKSVIDINIHVYVISLLGQCVYQWCSQGIVKGGTMGL